MRRPLPYVALLVVACADVPPPPAGLAPEAHARAPRGSLVEAQLIEPAADRELQPAQPVNRASSPPPAALAEPRIEPARISALGPRGERILELEAARRAYLARPGQSRTPHASEVYRLELLELGQALASAAASADARSQQDAKTLRARAAYILEELGLEAGDQSDFGLRAYQLLADLHRAGGNEEDALAYEKEIDRVIEGTPPEPTPPTWR